MAPSTFILPTNFDLYVSVTIYVSSLFSPAWDCSAWVRTYALFLEERLECFRILKYDIEAERLPRPSQGQEKVIYLVILYQFYLFLIQLVML